MTELYLNKEYNGTIIKKFEDLKNHVEQTPIIETNYQELTYKKYRDLSGLYEFAQVGDRIIKEKANLQVQIIREGEKYFF